MVQNLIGLMLERSKGAMLRKAPNVDVINLYTPIVTYQNQFDRRNLPMALLERFLVVTRYARPWLQYDYDVVVALLRKKH